tara:strand:- start:540 stop:773 length:234 start_codon:yes stop_codon:yes gene_type:complete
MLQKQLKMYIICFTIKIFNLYGDTKIILKEINKMKLGDLIYYITKYTGIKYVWKKINPNCNCDKRRSDWNKFKIKRW